MRILDTLVTIVTMTVALLDTSVSFYFCKKLDSCHHSWFDSHCDSSGVISIWQVLETCDNGRQMIEEDYPQADNFQDKIDQLMAEWDDLKGAVADRTSRLDDSEVAQQYLFDAAEAEAFMGEQELFLMSDERAKVTPSYPQKANDIFIGSCFANPAS